jgi:hypothetical protein
LTSKIHPQGTLPAVKKGDLFPLPESAWSILLGYRVDAAVSWNVSAMCGLGLQTRRGLPVRGGDVAPAYGVLVREDFPGIVAKEYPVPLLGDNGVGLKRDLAPCTGKIDHKPRDGQSRSVSLHAGEDFDSLGERCPEVLGSDHTIALVQVVRSHADAEESLAQGCHRVRPVVHAPKEHALVVEGHTGSQEAVARLGCFRGDLSWVIELGDEPDRSVPLQHAAQIGGDPLGQDNRHPAADADDLDVSNRANPVQHLVEFPIRQKQRVTTGQQDIPDFPVTLEVLEHSFPMWFIVSCRSFRPKSFSKAVSAVHRASAGCQHDHPVRVAVNQAGDSRVLPFGEWIHGAGIGRIQLRQAWKNLQPQRVLRILPSDQRQKIGCDGKGIIEGDPACDTLFLRTEPRDVSQVPRLYETMVDLPSPVVPVQWGCPKISGAETKSCGMGMQWNRHGDALLEHTENTNRTRIMGHLGSAVILYRQARRTRGFVGGSRQDSLLDRFFSPILYFSNAHHEQRP